MGSRNAVPLPQAYMVCTYRQVQAQTVVQTPELSFRYTGAGQEIWVSTGVLV